MLMFETESRCVINSLKFVIWNFNLSLLIVSLFSLYLLYILKMYMNNVNTNDINGDYYYDNNIIIIVISTRTIIIILYLN